MDEIRGRRVAVPNFEIASNPRIQLSTLKSRMRLDVECPACRTRHFDLRGHVGGMDDDLHAVLDVQES